jgi:hypothetical protein
MINIQLQPPESNAHKPHSFQTIHLDIENLCKSEIVLCFSFQSNEIAT